MQIILTGTSQGLGKEFFDILVKQNIKLIALSRKFLNYQIKLAKNNSYIQLIEIDFSNIESLIEKLEQIKINDENLIFINNAGTILPIATIEHISAQNIIDAYNINTIAPAIIVQHFSKKQLLVLNISTGAANRAIDNWGLYCSSKAGIKMLFDVINISDCNNIEIIHFDPGVLDTQMQKEIRDSEFIDKEEFINLFVQGHLKSPHKVAMDVFTNYIEKRLIHEKA